VLCRFYPGEYDRRPGSSWTVVCPDRKLRTNHPSLLSSLSYSSTMELLETARVDVYSLNDVVVPAARRSQVLCVVWEGTCAELPARRFSTLRRSKKSSTSEGGEDEVWHAGDWTGPIYLQPEVKKSGESLTSNTHDVVAISPEGVKVITIDFPGLHAILKSGSQLYRRFLDRNADQERAKMDVSSSENHSTTDQLLDDAKKELNVLELLNCNSCLKKLTAIQKRHLESLAVGPISYQQGERLWGAGTPVDKAFIVISGTASFVQKRRNAGSAAVQAGGDVGDASVGVSMRVDAEQAVKELGVRAQDAHGDDHSSVSSTDHEDRPNSSQKIVFDSIYHEHAQLSRGLQKRADYLKMEGGSVASGLSGFSGGSHEEEGESENHEHGDDGDVPMEGRRSSVVRRRSSRARYANKVLGRLYSRRAFTGGLVFSRGHFLGDVSKMVAALLSSDAASETGENPTYGFGDKSDGGSDDALLLATITETQSTTSDHPIMHSSTLTAGKDGCVVLVFPKASLIPFLDEYPGLLLGLLGTQVVV
jgi:CRP-like cAMP-binding protein